MQAERTVLSELMQRQGAATKPGCAEKAVGAGDDTHTHMHRGLEPGPPEKGGSGWAVLWKDLSG